MSRGGKSLNESELSTSHSGYTVTISEAQTVAMNFMTQLYPERYGQSKIIGSRLLNLKNGNLPDLYVVDIEPDGWVMVSSDKRYAPIMAYGSEGRVTNAKEEEMPPASLFWLEMNMEAQRQTTDDDASNIRQWEELLGNSTASIIDPDDCEEVSSYIEINAHARFDAQTNTYQGYLTTQWRQGYPYNYYFPVLYGSAQPAGCTTISLAQVVRYWEHSPNTYNWNIMPDECSTIYQNGSIEVARLIKDVADEIQVEYNLNATSGQVNDKEDNDKDVYEALQDWGYDVDFKFWKETTDGTFRQAFPISIALGTEDISLLNNELINKRPMIFSGFPRNYDSSPGHAWVCDGYAVVNLVKHFVCSPLYDDYTRRELLGTFYHMNWGWGAEMNGWYNFRVFYQTDAFHYNIYEHSISISSFNAFVNKNFGYQFMILYNIKPH